MADTGKTIGLIKALASVDPEVIQSSVEGWLDDHPEATTTVQDGSITKAKLDQNLQSTVDDVGDLKSAMNDVKNLEEPVLLNDSYSGTRYLKIDKTFPAGKYHITIESVTSSDTDKTQSAFAFLSGSTELVNVKVNRGVPVDVEVTLESQATSLYLYASISYAFSANDTFAFSNFKISESYNLLDEVNAIKDDVSALQVTSNKYDYRINSIDDALKFYEETYTVKASTEHSPSDDMLIVSIPSGATYRIELSSTSVISNDINVKAFYSDDTNEYVKSGCHVPSINNLTATKNTIALGFWSASNFSSNNVNINVKVYVDDSVLDIYQKIDWDEVPVLDGFQIKTLKVFDSFTPNVRTYSFSSGATINNYNNYATTSTVSYNTPPIKVRNKDGTLIYKNLHVTPKDASTYAAWTFDINGNFLRSVTFAAIGSRETPFLSDEYYAILNEYPTTSGYTDTHWYVDDVNIEWLNNPNGAVYTVGDDGDFATFTAMLIALEDDSSEKTVYVKGGTYDVFTEMGGADYIASIASSVSELNWRDVCHVVPPNTKIVGLGNVVLSWQPTAEQMISEEVAFLFSPLNVSGTCVIENISVVAKNCRYVVHDETSGLSKYDGAKHYYKNCRFTLLSGSYGFILYGAGHNKLMDIRFDNCVFDSQNASMIWSTHDWTTPVNENSVFVFNSCVFISSIANPYVRFSSGDQVGRLDKVMFNNCYLERIKFVTTGSTAKQGYDVQLIGCSPVVVEYDDLVTDRVAVRQYNPIPQST